jgi:hypothetical protein
MYQFFGCLDEVNKLIVDSGIGGFFSGKLFEKLNKALIKLNSN